MYDVSKHELSPQSRGRGRVWDWPSGEAGQPHRSNPARLKDQEGWASVESKFSIQTGFSTILCRQMSEFLLHATRVGLPR